MYLIKNIIQLFNTLFDKNIAIQLFFLAQRKASKNGEASNL